MKKFITLGCVSCDCIFTCTACKNKVYAQISNDDKFVAKCDFCTSRYVVKCFMQSDFSAVFRVEEYKEGCE